MRRAMRSRFCSSVRGIGSRLGSWGAAVLRPYGRSLFPHGAALDFLFVVRALEDGVDENARGVNLIGRKLAKLDELFYFGDYVIGGGGHHGIEVARSFSVAEIAPAIAFPGFDESEVTAQGALQNVMAAVEFARFFAFGNHGDVARGGVEGGNARAACSDALGKSALRIQLDLHLAAED